MQNCRIILENIKKSMKNKMLTYKDLAQHLDMSEMGIKRTLNAEDISINRLARICDFLNISISELFALSEKPELVEQNISEDAYVAFESDMNLFKIFFLLSIEQITIKQIQKKYNLTDRSVRYYLNQLEKVEVIERLADNKIKLKVGGNFWSKPHPFRNKFKEECVQNFIRQISKSTDKNKVFFPFFCFYLSENTRNELEIELQSLYKKYWLQARNDAHIFKRNQMQLVSVSIQMATLSFIDVIENI